MKNLIALIIIVAPFALFALNKPESGDENDSLTAEDQAAVSFFDTSSIYLNDWNNNVTFSYPEANYNPSGKIDLTSANFGYAFPVEKETTSGFGSRRYSYHKGIDIPLQTGDDVVAAFGGKVRYAKWNSGGYGNLVIIRHPNGLETYYAHLSKIKVKPNDIVSAGDLVGHGGSTGKSYSPHLHFEVRYNHVAFDPRHIFNLDDYCLKTESIELESVINRGKGNIAKDLSSVEVELEEAHEHGDDEKEFDDSKTTQKIKESGSVKYYSVRSGDSLSKIAGRNGTTVDKLCKLNQLSRNSVLQIGQKIRVN